MRAWLREVEAQRPVPKRDDVVAGEEVRHEAYGAPSDVWALGVVAYEVRAARDGKLEHIGRFKSKLAAAVAFSRFEAGMPSRRGGQHLLLQSALFGGLMGAARSSEPTASRIGVEMGGSGSVGNRAVRRENLMKIW